MKMSHVTVALANHVSEGVIVTDASGLVYVNPSALTLLGVGCSLDVLGKPLSVVFRPDDASEILQPIASCTRGGNDREMPVVGKLLRVGGGTVEVCGTSFPVQWKGAGRCHASDAQRQRNTDGRAHGQGCVYRSGRVSSPNSSRTVSVLA